MSEKVELPYIFGSRHGGRIRLYGTPLSDENKVFGSFNPSYIISKPKRKKKKIAERTAVLVEDNNTINKEGKYILVNSLLANSKVKTGDMFDFLDVFAGKGNHHELSQELFTAGLGRISTGLSDTQCRELFSILDRDYTGIVYLHQLSALVAIAWLERGSELDTVMESICIGIIWESLFCSTAVPSPKRVFAGGGGRPSYRKNSMAPPSVAESKDSLRKAAIKERKRKRKKLHDEIGRCPLPLIHVISILRSICPPETFSSDDATLDDPLEVFIAALYEMLRTTSCDKKKTSRGKQIFRGFSLDEGQGYNSGGNVSSVGGGNSIPSDNECHNGSRSRPTIVTAKEVTYSPIGEGETDNSLLSGSDMALSRSAISISRDSLRTANKKQLAYSLTRDGSLGIHTPGIEKLSVTLPELCEFVATQCEFQIRLQTEQFNWIVKRQQYQQNQLKSSSRRISHESNLATAQTYPPQKRSGNARIVIFEGDCRTFPR